MGRRIMGGIVGGLEVCVGIFRDWWLVKGRIV
jgi:hypothetical protein